MRPGTLFLLVLLPLFWGCSAEPGSLTSAQEAELRAEVAETLSALTEAMNSHDPDAVFSFYRQDETFYYLGCTSVLFGWSTFSSRTRPYYENQTDVTFERELLFTQILEPTVAVAALRGSSTEADALFWTQVLQKNEDGQWLVTYEHESWPGCPAPRGPHMGTTGEPGDVSAAPEPMTQGS